MNATTHYNGEETNSIKLKRKQLTFNNRSLEPSSFLLLFTLFSNRTDAPDTAKQILPEREKQKRKKKKERKRRRRKKKRRLLFPLNTGLAKSPSPFSAVQLMDWAEVTREPHGTSSRNLKPLTCFPCEPSFARYSPNYAHFIPREPYPSINIPPTNIVHALNRTFSFLTWTRNPISPPPSNN